MKSSIATFFIGCFLLFISHCIFGQSLLYHNNGDGMIRLELNKPFFDDLDDVGFITSTNYINGHIPVGDQFEITAEVPFSFFTLDNGQSEFSENHLGNIGLGGMYRTASGKFMGELQFRLPTTSDDAILYAPTVDLSRPGSFINTNFSVRLLANYIHMPSEGFFFRFRGGLNGLFPDEELTDDDMELWLHLSGQGGYAFEIAKIFLNLETLTTLSEDELDFSERNINMLEMGGEYTQGDVRPSLFFRFPLEEESNIDFILGASVAYLIR